MVENLNANGQFLNDDTREGDKEEGKGNAMAACYGWPVTRPDAPYCRRDIPACAGVPRARDGAVVGRRLRGDV